MPPSAFFSTKGDDISNWSPHWNIHIHPQEPQGLGFHSSTGGVSPGWIRTGVVRTALPWEPEWCTSGDWCSVSYCREVCIVFLLHAYYGVSWSSTMCMYVYTCTYACRVTAPYWNRSHLVPLCNRVKRQWRRNISTAVDKHGYRTETKNSLEHHPGCWPPPKHHGG